MADESAKRFQQIMDRLYHFPKSSGGGAGSSQKGKRGGGCGGDLSSRKCVDSGVRKVSDVGNGAKDWPQLCRPWDRGDLFRRLSTFKAMTWFGKPKAVSPVNCARRGWINVDMDTIACEACGSRLLFSTPSSWTLNQVEKAAAVFSLKLDNGHKLLCPWKDNICDEFLALFPPTPDPDLVEGYRKRASAMLRLSALPVISPSAIDHITNPQLEQLLEETSSIGSTLDKCIKLNDDSSHLLTDYVSDAASTSLYFQAQKIISLCGWELCLLSYYVDYEMKSDHSVEKAKSSAVVYSSHTSMDIPAEEENQESLKNQCDPASAVLDCKFCGARVGLWAFKSIPRPLELFNLSDFPDVGNQNDSNRTNNMLEQQEIHACDSGGKNPSSIGLEGSSILNLTIAGGLPPAKQNFRPRVSLPIISRHLRAELSTVYDAKDYSSPASLGKDNAIDQAQSSDALQHQIACSNGERAVSSESTETLKRKRDDNEFRNFDNEEASITCESSHEHKGSSVQEVGKEKLVGNENNNMKIDRFLDSCPTSDPVAVTSGMPMRMQLINTGVFDPIGQHRPFCPWIVSGNGNGTPGWKLTLSAVIQDKDSSPSVLKQAPLRLVNEVDDPVISVRRLFATPLSKKIRRQ